MTPGNQSQRAGQGSSQIQTSGHVFTGAVAVTVGLDETRAREIVHEEFAKFLAEQAEESAALIHARVSQFEDRLIPLIHSIEALDSFADPAFIRSYRKAQEGAAASERPADYDMLAAMLADRVGNRSDRPRIAGIDRAIEIVDRIDDEALRGITVYNMLTTVIPTSSLAREGLDYLDQLLALLLDGPLPAGLDWLDHLDVMTAVRLESGSRMVQFAAYYPRLMSGYVSPGRQATEVPKNLTVGPLESPEYVTPWTPFVTDHEYKPGFVRFRASTEQTISESMEEGLVSEDLIAAIVQQAKVELRFGEVDKEAVVGFMDDLNTRPALALAAAWWDQIPTHFRLTSVGRTLARANAFRLEPSGLFPRE